MSDLLGMFGLFGAIGSSVAAVMTGITYLLVPYRREKAALGELAAAIRGAYRISVKELRTLMRRYVQQNFQLHSAGGDVIKTRQLADRINKAENTYLFLVGEAGLGKSTALRYLFYRLSKSLFSSDCVYISMSPLDSLEEFEKLLDESLCNKKNVNVFMDALDEAKFLYDEAGRITFDDLITTLQKYVLSYKNNSKNIKNMILTCRREIMPKGAGTISEELNVRGSVEVWELLKMSGPQIMKSFRMLRYLKKTDPVRYEYVFPDKKKSAVVRKLKKYIKENKDTFFAYPLFIRYANLFLEDAGGEDADEVNDSFIRPYQTVIDKIIKWEFHVDFEHKREGQSAEGQQVRLKEYRAKAYQFIENIAAGMCAGILEGRGARIKREELLAIPSENYLNGSQRLTRHLLVFDEGTGEFAFCHLSFLEFFAGRFLAGQGIDYHLRRKMLSVETMTELKDFYYAFLCEDRALALRIGQSCTSGYSGMLTPFGCLALEKMEEVLVCSCPAVSIAEIYEVLPLVKAFAYRGMKFDQEEICSLLDEGILNLPGRPIGALSEVGYIAPLIWIKDLDISGLALDGDFHPLGGMSALERLDIRRTSGWEEAIPFLSSLKLKHICVCTERESVIEELVKLPSEIIYVETEDYSPVWLHMHKAEKGRLKPYRRTFLENARKKWKAARNTEEIGLLSAVFYEELDAFGLEKNADATLWNGLSLAAALHLGDCLDEDGAESAVLKRIKPFLEDRMDELGLNFCKLYGDNRLMLSENQEAVWAYKKGYENGENVISSKFKIRCGLELFHSYVIAADWDRCGLLLAELEPLIEGIEVDSNENCRYLKHRCAYYLKKEMYGEAYAVIRQFKQAAEKVESFWFNASYYEILWHTRMDHFKEAAALLPQLKTLVRQECEGERKIQADWLKYHELRMITACGLNDAEEACEAAQAMYAFPYRVKKWRKNACLYVLVLYGKEIPEGIMREEKMWYADFNYLIKGAIWT